MNKYVPSPINVVKTNEEIARQFIELIEKERGGKNCLLGGGTLHIQRILTKKDNTHIILEAITPIKTFSREEDDQLITYALPIYFMISPN